eukprot:scaffold208933_cov21-Tisochrysis_lutea.AAC.1
MGQTRAKEAPKQKSPGRASLATAQPSLPNPTHVPMLTLFFHTHVQASMPSKPCPHTPALVLILCKAHN